MQIFRVLPVLIFGLSGCFAPPPNDGDQYHENKAANPAATELKAAEDRLARAEGIAEPQKPVETIETQPLSGVAPAPELNQPVTVQTPVAPEQGTRVNLAKYALAQTNPVGTKIYSRFVLNRAFTKNRCAQYASSNDAQTAFLQAGGPNKDRLGLDPDGDGYACSWTPETYRRLLQ